ncbi:MAG: bifunctional oligoribonuclease/PAP phosphatase NrnA [Halobacteriales archaeon]
MARAPVTQLSGLLDRLVSFAGDSPLLAAAIVVLVLVGLAVAAFLLRRYLRPSGRKFRRAIADLDEIAVLMHPNPDPDAMSTALGVAHIADGVDTDATLYYPGQIRHQENRAFRTVLEMEATNVSSSAEIDGEVVLVDHNEPRGIQAAGRITPYAVVDHHPGGGAGTEYTDVRTEYGACATIIAEYFQDLGFEPDNAEDGSSDPDQRLPTNIATGLMYGIQSDTNNLTKGCSPAEFSASAYLYEAVDGNLLDRIANPSVDAEVLDTRAKAITERELRSPFAIADVGSVSNLDAIPQAADELLGLEGVEAVVVFGDDDDSETIHVSGRSRDDRVHMGEALESVVDDIPMAQAGGHARMGGGQLSIPHMKGLREDSGLTREEFRDRVFAALSGEI